MYTVPSFGLGFYIPAIISLCYIVRFRRKFTVDDLLILIPYSLITYAAKNVTDEGVFFTPFFAIPPLVWAFLCSLPNYRGLHRPLAVVFVFTFLSLLIPDVASSLNPPTGRVSVVGGAGVLDGLLIYPVLITALTFSAYRSKYLSKRSTLDASSFDYQSLCDVRIR